MQRLASWTPFCLGGRKLYFFAAAIAVGATVVGCGLNHKANVPTAAVNVSKQRLGYVRIGVLVDRHPLQQDVRRLRAAEVRLVGLESRLPSSNVGDSASLSGYLLPALNADGGTHPSSAAAARKARRTAQRDKFAVSVGDELNSYAIERNRRHQRLIDQRRVELLAVDANGEAVSERSAREIEDAKVRTGIENLADDVLKSRSAIAILDAQLENPTGDILMSVPNDATFLKQAEQLQQKVQPPGIGMPVRLRVKRLDQVATLKRLETELDDIRRQGMSASDDAALRVQKERLAEIDRELGTLSDDVRMRALLESEDSSMNDLLSAEARTAARFVSQGALLEGPYGTSGRASLPIIFGGRIGSLDRTGVAQAIARIQRQRARLERYIRLDVATAIQDVASSRNIDIVSVNTPGQALPPSAAALGREDMTASFEVWIQQPGQFVGAQQQHGAVRL